jgi:hypothetical protein
MLFVLFWILGKDQYIIQVANNKIVQEFAENIVHQILEDGWGINKSKRHDVVFKMPIPCFECNLPFITFFDVHQVISSSKIDLGINLGLS